MRQSSTICLTALPNPFPHRLRHDTAPLRKIEARLRLALPHRLVACVVRHLTQTDLVGKGKQPLLRYFLVRPAIDCLKLRAAACTAEGRLRRLPNLFIKAGKVAMCFDMHGM